VHTICGKSRPPSPVGGRNGGGEALQDDRKRDVSFQLTPPRRLGGGVRGTGGGPSSRLPGTGGEGARRAPVRPCLRRRRAALAGVSRPHRGAGTLLDRPCGGDRRAYP